MHIAIYFTWDSGLPPNIGQPAKETSWVMF